MIQSIHILHTAPYACTYMRANYIYPCMYVHTLLHTCTYSHAQACPTMSGNIAKQLPSIVKHAI